MPPNRAFLVSSSLRSRRPRSEHAGPDKEKGDDDGTQDPRQVDRYGCIEVDAVTVLEACISTSSPRLVVEDRRNTRSPHVPIGHARRRILRNCQRFVVVFFDLVVSGVPIVWSLIGVGPVEFSTGCGSCGRSSPA